ncbi:MAG: PIN domain-containing protein [Rhizomicrobium sp.]
MRAIDTNLLVRLLVRDDAREVAAAEEFVSSGAWISHLVLAEATWVLDSVYEFDASAIADAVGMLLEHAQFAIQDSETVRAALANFRRRPSVRFSDCLIVEVARRNGHLPIGTFDRDLGRFEGVERLQGA